MVRRERKVEKPSHHLGLFDEIRKPDRPESHLVARLFLGSLHSIGGSGIFGIFLALVFLDWCSLLRMPLILPIRRPLVGRGFLCSLENLLALGLQGHLVLFGLSLRILGVGVLLLVDGSGASIRGEDRYLQMVRG
jgi:hypothetical protein